MLTMIWLAWICSVDWNNAFQYCFHIEDCWFVFTDLLTQSVNKHVPVVHIHKPKVKQSIRHYPNYIRKLFKEKAIAWKRWRITKLEYNKNKTAAAKCSSAVNKWKLLGSSVWCQFVVWRLSLSGKSGSTWVVEGPNTWEATGGHGPGDVRVRWRTMTDGLVAWGDCMAGPTKLWQGPGHF